jgi:hypothetical protein
LVAGRAVPGLSASRCGAILRDLLTDIGFFLCTDFRPLAK